ncbi:hypothetical protein J3Q64DRAFT_1224824 [Phycomyces blakesleeanus]|uniref:Uncharacterized protein n=1 Tax=Phycomyces blakesleeanus TaxID=4837 RepID=A0ABR3B9F0_PHYBL
MHLMINKKGDHIMTMLSIMLEDEMKATGCGFVILVARVLGDTVLDTVVAGNTTLEEVVECTADITLISDILDGLLGVVVLGLVVLGLVVLGLVVLRLMVDGRRRRVVNWRRSRVGDTLVMGMGLLPSGTPGSSLGGGSEDGNSSEDRGELHG